MNLSWYGKEKMNDFMWQKGIDVFLSLSCYAIPNTCILSKNSLRFLSNSTPTLEYESTSVKISLQLGIILIFNNNV